jgi:hypothetical protein
VHRDRDRLKAGLLLVGAVGFAVLGQFYFLKRREYVWDGILFFSLALICFAWLIATAARTVRPLRKEPTPTARERWRQLVRNRRAVPVALALFLNLIAARSANAHPPPGDYTLSVLLWISSLVLFFFAFVPPPNPWPATQRAAHTLKRAIRGNHQHAAELALVVGLILVGLYLRAWNLGHIPANLSGDEGTQGLWAVDVLKGGLRNPFSTGWYTVPTMSFFAQAASLRLFGDSVAGLRTLSALIGTATLIFSYLFARRNLGRRVGLFTLAALTFNHYHIHYSRLGSNQIADPFFAVLTLWLFTEGLRRTTIKDPKTENGRTITTRATGWFLAAGLTLGLGWYGYFGSRVTVLVLAAYLFTQAILKRGFLGRNSRSLALMTVIAVMAVSPLILHYSDSPQDLSARFNQVNFFRWLDNELARPDHDSVFSLVVRQAWRSISAFNYTLDPTFWYGARIPLLDFVSGILFVLGLAVALSQWRRSIMRLILFGFGFAIIFGWVLTENPPSSMRMVIISPVVALLVALGLDRLIVLARWSVGGSREQWNWIAAALLAVAALLNVYYYFVVYTPARFYGNPTAETATVFAHYVHNGSMAGRFVSDVETDPAQDGKPFVYFYGPPFLYYDFGTIEFIARDVPGRNVPPKDEEPELLTQVSGPTVFLVLPERLDELPDIKARHPYGQLFEFHSDANGRLLFVVYEVLP